MARVCGRVLLSAMVCAGLVGCSYFRNKPSDKYVYVTAKQTFLRDRVAAVSNRTGSAQNGEKLVVLERARRFLKVRTPRGEVGWIEEKLTAGQEVADQFEALRREHEKDPIVAQATARDEVYLHETPGRESERFFRLAEGETMSLLERAAVEKPLTTGGGPTKKTAADGKAAAAAKIAEESKKAVETHAADEGKTATAAGGEAAATEPPPAPPMEDWWLVRNSKGQTGWIYGRMIDVTVPDALARYAEGQRIVGAYVLAHVYDPDSGILSGGQTVTDIEDFVTLLAPYKTGLPYDFNQVRAFTWNLKKHRYETAFREHNIAGYLPLLVAPQKDPYGRAANATVALPGFSYRVLAADVPMPEPDPTTGLLTPVRTITKTYRLEGNLIRRIMPPGTAPLEAHPVLDSEKGKGKGKGKGKKRKSSK
jgi:SH3-like domain-containing protein